MQSRKPNGLLACAVAFALTGLSPNALGDTVKVQMLDKGPDGAARVFRPPLVHISPGDTVHFVATDFGHDVKSISGLQPDGANSFSGYKNAPLKATLSQPGVHIYECESHRKKGMVGAIVVGDAPVDLEALQSRIEASGRISDKGQKRLDRILQRIKPRKPDS